MFHNVKVVIGANYGDEGKGMMTRSFTKEATRVYEEKPLIILHNGTAQRGHTVDFDEKTRHVFHHFGSGALDDADTYFAETFLIHPMTFAREMKEFNALHKRPGLCYYHPNCEVITPFDMAADHATMAYIQKMNGSREYGTCGFGSWCALIELLMAIIFLRKVLCMLDMNIIKNK